MGATIVPVWARRQCRIANVTIHGCRPGSGPTEPLNFPRWAHAGKAARKLNVTPCARPEFSSGGELAPVSTISIGRRILRIVTASCGEWGVRLSS